MNLSFPDTQLLSCSAAFVPWVGALAAKATVLLAALVYIAANLLADIGAILLNPRLRKG